MQPTTNTKQPDRPAQEPDSVPEQAESARVLQRLADRVGPKNYENWFLGRCTVTVEGDEVRFGVGSPFVVSWMQRQFREAMQGTATDVLGPSARVRLDVDPNVMPEVVGDGGSTANKRTSAVGGALDPKTRLPAEIAIRGLAGVDQGLGGDSPISAISLWVTATAWPGQPHRGSAMRRLTDSARFISSGMSVWERRTCWKASPDGFGGCIHRCG